MRRGALMSAPREAPVLHRYFFYGWLFRDASVGTFLERAAALAYNREQSRWLPTYILRWLTVTLVFFTIGQFFDLVVGSPSLSALFFCLTSFTLAFNTVTGGCWILLKKA